MPHEFATHTDLSFRRDEESAVAFPIYRCTDTPITRFPDGLWPVPYGLLPIALAPVSSAVRNFLSSLCFDFAFSPNSSPCLRVSVVGVRLLGSLWPVAYRLLP